MVLAGRTPSKIDDAEGRIRAEVPAAELDRIVVDLSDLESVRHAGGRAATLGPIDVLVNNAGVMGTSYQRTGDGLELQMATNHFGPFLLTGLLLPQLVASEDARVVCVSSPMHRVARKAPLGDPTRKEGRYSKWAVYSQTKLANLLFTYELERRCREAELPVKALAAHPGFAGTHLAANGQYGRASGGIASVLDAAVKVVSQSPAAGAWPTLMAATADLPGGTYCGPSGLAEMGGSPQVVTSTAALPRRGRPAPALGDQREDHRYRLPLSGVSDRAAPDVRRSAARVPAQLQLPERRPLQRLARSREPDDSRGRSPG